MIDAEHAAASWFLLLSTTLFLVVYALPLLLAPLWWARRFRWRLPSGDTGLTVYFGRCLGALALCVIVVVFRAVPEPKAHRDLFDLIALIGGSMTLVHGWGALRRTQPWTEDAEILIYAALAFGAAAVRSTLLG